MSSHPRKTKRAVQVGVGQSRSVARSTDPRRNLQDLVAIVSLLFNCRRQRERFRKARPVHPGEDRVAQLEPGEAQRDPHDVNGTGPREDERIPARFKHPQALPPQLGTGNEGVPFATHEPGALVRVRLTGEPLCEALPDRLRRVIG